MRRRCFLGRWAVAAALALTGCGSGAPYVDGSLEEATVKGTVKVRGKFLDGGEVHFNPSNSKRPVGGRDAPIAKDGTFTVKTLVGLNVVTVTPPQARKKAQYGLEYEEKTVDVKSGENTVTLEYLQ
jgi:hypothetical protein